MNEKVKITKVAENEYGDPRYELITDEHGVVTKGRLLMEDIVGEIVHWGKKAAMTDDNQIVYQTVVYIRRWDDGTIEEALPGEVVYLDFVEDED